MIGASAEELSAAVQWYYWGFFIGQMVEDVVQCICYAQTMDRDNPWIALPKVWIRAGLVEEYIFYSKIPSYYGSFLCTSDP